jgi:hypothetical protein
MNSSCPIISLIALQGPQAVQLVCLPSHPYESILKSQVSVTLAMVIVLHMNRGYVRQDQT